MLSRLSTVISALVPLLLFATALVMADESSMMVRLETFKQHSIPTNNNYGCVAFSPETGPYNPNSDEIIPESHIDKLMDALVEQSNFECIATYRVIKGNDYVTKAAKARGLKVMLGLWIDGNDAQETNANIERGIELAKEYEDTVIGISCGSEVRVRHAKEIAEPLTIDCIDRVRAAGVKQPIGVRDLWYDWCDAQTPCAAWTTLADKVDWIGINIFPYWENWFSGSCIKTEDSAKFHLDIYKKLKGIYGQDKTIMVTEFGWPAAGSFSYPGLQPPAPGCAETTEENQQIVINETLKIFRDNGVPSVVFQAFRSAWKANDEGSIGAYWGICEGDGEMNCTIPVIGIPDTLPIGSSGSDGTGGDGSGDNNDGRNNDGSDTPNNASMNDHLQDLFIGGILLLCSIVLLFVQ